MWKLQPKNNALKMVSESSTWYPLNMHSAPLSSISSKHIQTNRNSNKAVVTYLFHFQSISRRLRNNQTRINISLQEFQSSQSKHDEGLSKPNINAVSQNLTQSNQYKYTTPKPMVQIIETQAFRFPITIKINPKPSKANTLNKI